MVAYEILTGFKPFYEDYKNISDYELKIKIMRGFHPKIPSYLPNLLIKLIEKCWNKQVNLKPTSKELYQILKGWYNEMLCNKNTEFMKQIKNAEKEIYIDPLPKNWHPKTYTSNLLDISDNNLDCESIS
ncbi:1593_t:CDS:2, partial [Funneliformis caledonium]